MFGKSEKKTIGEKIFRATYFYLLLIVFIYLYLLVVLLVQSGALQISKSNISLIVLLTVATLVIIYITKNGAIIKQIKKNFSFDLKTIFFSILISIVSVICLMMFKYIIIRYSILDLFNKSTDFLDLSIFKRLPILYYPINVFIQEVMIRCVIQENIEGMFDMSTSNEWFSAIITSIICGIFHFHMGLMFVVFVTIFLSVLGYIYIKQKNLWGVCIIHYIFAISATMLGIIG